MERTVLTDDSGRWFDRDKAEKFDEATRWDGHNHISLATGSQWNHEVLYRTAGRKWILHYWSQWQGSRPSWTEISAEEAAKWLITNGLEHPDVETHIADLEVK